MLESAESWDAWYRDDPRSVMVRDVVLPRAIRDLEPGKALDIGCGIGTQAFLLASYGWAVTGVDVSPEAIRLANLAAHEQGVDVRFIAADATTWTPDQPYDLVISTYALPGGADTHKVMATIARALRPGGTLLVVEWDHTMTELWGMDADDLPSPSDLVAMVPDFDIETAESRTMVDMLRDDPWHTGVDATIAYLRARKPDEPA